VVCGKILTFAAMKREIAKWFLDLAKYVTTAYLLSEVFEGISSPLATWATVTTIVLFFAIGAYMLHDEDKRQERKEKNRNKKK